MDLILASQSPYRKALLQNFGLTFKTLAPKVNEDALKLRGPRDLIELTRFLAYEKANSLQDEHPRAIILGSDQVVELDGERLDKPGSVARAAEQLQSLQGRSHRLITSLCVIAPADSYMFTDVTTIHLRKLSAEDIAAYLHLDQPYDCAGSYKIEKAGLALVEKIETQDPSAIQGLPLLSLTTAFHQLAIPLSELWGKT